jgi:hypothetical protein
MLLAFFVLAFQAASSAGSGQTHVQIIKSKDVIDLFLEFQYDTKKRI